jgi:dTDP-4-amino-4,6-dideoxygalactose transaminase
MSHLAHGQKPAIRTTPPHFVPALPTLAPSHFALPKAPRERLPFPLNLPSSRARYYYLARAGIARGLGEYKLPAGAVCLMPAYHHGIEVEAVRAAGLEPRFYRICRDTSVDLDDVALRLDRLGGRVAVLYVTHFCGFPAPIREARALADERGLLLVEDCALACFSRMPTGEPLGSVGDLAVFCLYKSIPVPHGGVLVSPRLPAPPMDRARLVATGSHLGGSLLRRLETRNRLGARVRSALRRLFRVVPAQARAPVGLQHLQPFELELGASRLLDWILPNLPYASIVARRRRNYRRLGEAVGFDRVPTGELPDRCCPLFLPIDVADRERALQALFARGIEAIDLWREGFEDAAEFPDAAALRRHTIELPCHQDLDDATIDHVARVLREVA